ncbi:glycosyltransferase family 2 protein [Capnocytophaga stomatis]|uniref:Glycosyltransferase family 2 protein n=1 Tax=Capnocytophaga stomatis TaxID=1848904 RepID=A0ABW8QA10_9FLAO|nr:glycosyltransferase family 2 protein [Capnocytophaga stomatis]
MKISITLPVYNNLEGLELSLQSILEQTYSDWEVIIVDDGSIENHEIVVNKFRDERIRFFRLEKNKGRAVARQKTFEALQGEYCAFLDAGDCYEKNFLENAVNIFSNHNDLLGVSQTMKIVYKNNLYLSRIENDYVIDIKSPMFQKISFASTVIRSDLCKNYRFNFSLKHSEDREFLNHLSENYTGKIFISNSNSYIYNLSSENAKVSTTMKKYYYFGWLLFHEGKYLQSTQAFFKMLIGTLCHIVFGYEKLLEIRYKKPLKLECISIITNKQV